MAIEQMRKAAPIPHGQILTGPLFGETVRANGTGSRVAGLVGMQTDQNSLEWVTPGHPLFEALRRHGLEAASDAFARGACFHSLNPQAPIRLDVYRAKVVDGLGCIGQERLFAVGLSEDGEPRQRGLRFLDDLAPAAAPDDLPAVASFPEDTGWLIETALTPFLDEIRSECSIEVKRMAEHMELSLTEVLQRIDLEIGRAGEEADKGSPGAEGRRILSEDGIGSVVFAPKATEGREALLSGMIRGGWTITGSWPIATERASRLRTRDSAALTTSVHLICRLRPDDAPVSEWAEALRELPQRVADWIEHLQGEGVRGTDLVFACIGPALEIFSRYRAVETAEGREVGLPEYLEKVWEVVGRAALDQVLRTAEAAARNGMAGALEEDARLTALFLWALQSTEEFRDGSSNNADRLSDIGPSAENSTAPSEPDRVLKDEIAKAIAMGFPSPFRCRAALFPAHGHRSRTVDGQDRGAGEGRRASASGCGTGKGPVRDRELCKHRWPDRPEWHGFRSAADRPFSEFDVPATAPRRDGNRTGTHRASILSCNRRARQCSTACMPPC